MYKQDIQNKNKVENLVCSRKVTYKLENLNFLKHPEVFF